MAYSYTPGNPDDEEEEKRRGLTDSELTEQPQPAATTPNPSADGDPFRRNTTAVPGNPETRYGAVATPAAPTRAALPDAFDRPVQPQLLVPSPAVTEAAPVSPAIGAPAPVLNAPAPQPVRVPGAPPLTASPGIGSALTQPPPVAQPAVLPTSVPPAITPTAVPPSAAPVSPFPGTLPGSTPQANAQPVQPRDIIPDDEDAFRRRRAAY